MKKKIYLLLSLVLMTADIITTSAIQLAPTDANFIGKTTIEIDF